MAGDSGPSPEECLKSLIPYPPPNSESAALYESADREFQEDRPSNHDNPSRLCVICFSEDEKAERGKLDSCDHFFCFVCIMEWARIESRCPACKARFTTVLRMPNDGFLLRQRIIKVPMRNQVHLPGDSEPYDPYAETSCYVCEGIQDEGLMLLCDLCDLAAHTYCVGLGTSVPEGDWFCHDCTISRAQHADTEMDTVNKDQNQIETSRTLPSISELVQKFSSEIAGMPCKRVSLHAGSEASSIVSHQRSNMAHKSFHSSVDKATGTSARTLHRCRNIHGHIRLLRENWNALRKGSLNFSSHSSTSGGNRFKQDVSATPNNRTGQIKFSTPRILQQASIPECDESSYDVDKAWRMMELAKAKAKREGASRVDQTSRYPASRGINTQGKNNTSLSSHTVKMQPYKIKELTMLTIDEHYSSKKETSKRKFPALGERQFQPVASKKYKDSGDVFCSSSSSSYKGSSSSNAVQSFERNAANKIGRKPSNKILEEASSSSRMMGVSDKGHATTSEDAKSEIRTLVKMNLKLLGKDKNLGYERYKEIARLATHTIMAACGLEPPPKSSKRFCPSSVCSHAEDVRRLNRSTLMPDSCRECFFVLVKDVVNAVMTEKLGLNAQNHAGRRRL